MEQLQQRGQGPGLGLTAEGAELAVLIGQLWETSPWRPGGDRGRVHERLLLLQGQQASQRHSPLQVDEMSGQDTFDQGHRLAVAFSTQLPGKVELSTKEVAHWPEPFLLTHTHTHRGN